MELLKSSIMGREFINYRKNTYTYDRLRFSKSVRAKGLGIVPIVIDSIDKNISNMISENKRYKRHGRECEYHYETTIGDILLDIKELIPYENNIHIRLEDGTILDNKIKLEELYIPYRKEDDKILYLIVSKELTLYEYFLSIFNYLYNFGSLWGSTSSK